MLHFHEDKGSLITVAARTINDKKYFNTLFGNLIINPQNKKLQHYAKVFEVKPSNTYSCGIYIFSKDMQNILCEKQKNIEAKLKSITTNTEKLKMMLEFGYSPMTTDLERDIIYDMVRDGRVYCHDIDEFDEYCHLLSSYSSLLKCNSIFMNHFINKGPGHFNDNLNLNVEDISAIVKNKTFIHPSSQIADDCELGPNVYICKGVKVGPGVRISNSIILGGTEIYGFAMIKNTIIGFNSKIGPWTRLEGDSIENDKTINVLGVGVRVEPEIFIHNCIV